LLSSDLFRIDSLLAQKAVFPEKLSGMDKSQSNLLEEIERRLQGRRNLADYGVSQIFSPGHCGCSETSLIFLSVLFPVQVHTCSMSFRIQILYR
jgi:hypothetical protein